MAKVNQLQLEDFFTHHLPYEYDMLRGAAALLAQLPLPSKTEKAEITIQRNSLIESCGIHARNLIEFFKNKDSCDFEPRYFTEQGYKLKKSFVRSTLVDKINYQISHLTRNRTRVAEEKLTGGDIIELVRVIGAEMDRMLRSLRRAWGAKNEITIGTVIVGSFLLGASSEVSSGR